MKSHKVLVIGSNSFSGSHFVAGALEAGHPVCGVSRSPEPEAAFLPYRWPHYANGDPLASQDNFFHHVIDLNKDLSRLIEIIDVFKPTLIINFAAQGMVAESWANPTHWYRTNLLSQVAFHDELRKKAFVQKYVHFTTPEVYGSTNGEWITENNQFSPSTPYAVSRAACDLHLLSFQKAYDFPVVFTRAANVYGPGQQLYRIIPRTMLSTLTGKPMQLHGGGYSERSFIHISDVVSATLQIAYSGEPGTTWHLSTRTAISIRELVKMICSLAGVTFDSLVEIAPDRLGKDQSYLLDSSAIRKCFGWSDLVELDQGLKETMNWIDEHLEIFKSMPWAYQHKK